MALVVETGTGAADAEAYISVADAATYHSARGNAAWAAASTPDKEAALRRATGWLDARYASRWPGQRTNGRDQALMWPRMNATDAEGNAIGDDEIPVEIVNACAEAALRELEDPGSLAPDESTAGDVIRTRVKAGPVEEETEYAPGSVQRGQPKTPAIDNILASLIGAASANVVFLRRG
jgi:hypothetical protein